MTKDKESIGGDCLNWGCVPSKALLHAAKSVETARKNPYLKNQADIEVDPEKVFAHIKNSINTIKSHENYDYFTESRGWDIAIGTASFVGKNSLKINNEIYKAGKIILATGSVPLIPDIKGAEKVAIHTNETIFSLNKIPPKLLVIGGGPIGLELGQALAMLGSKVTIVDRGDKFMAREDPEIAEVLENKFKKLGIKFYPQSEVRQFSSSNTALIKTADKEESLDFDVVLVATGRRLDYTELNLEKANIKLSDKGLIKKDDYLRTTNHKVLVAGDASGPPFFTHATELHARVILNNFFKPRLLWQKLNYDKFSWVTFTSPEVAGFGQTEKSLRDKNIKYRTISKKFAENDRMITEGETNGLAKIFVSRKGYVLGGSVVGRGAGELIQELVLLMETKHPLSTLIKKTYAYPVANRLNKELAFAEKSEALTKKATKILRFLFKIFS